MPEQITTMQLVNEQQLSTMFSLDPVSLAKLRVEGLPHFDIRGARTYDLSAVIPWLKGRYYKEKDTDGPTGKSGSVETG